MMKTISRVIVDKKLDDFFKDFGISIQAMITKAPRYAKLSYKETRTKLLCDLMDRCISLVTDKYGVEDAYGMPLGFKTEQLARLMGAKKQNK